MFGLYGFCVFRPFCPLNPFKTTLKEVLEVLLKVLEVVLEVLEVVLGFWGPEADISYKKTVLVTEGVRTSMRTTF